MQAGTLRHAVALQGNPLARSSWVLEACRAWSKLPVRNSYWKLSLAITSLEVCKATPTDRSYSSSCKRVCLCFFSRADWRACAAEITWQPAEITWQEKAAAGSGE